MKKIKKYIDIFFAFHFGIHGYNFIVNGNTNKSAIIASFIITTIYWVIKAMDDWMAEDQPDKNTWRYRCDEDEEDEV